MLSKNLIAERLKRFELLAGMSYPQPLEVFKIWQEKAGEMTEDNFNKACSWIEDNAISWHILPTPTELKKAIDKIAKKYKGA